jgi:GT2 family glycosyltransferase
MTEPFVSIVIPTHNRKFMVVRLLKSIYASTYTHIEIIVVDDASTDGTMECIKRTFPNKPKLYTIHNASNVYTAGARNIGIHHARGKYIFFIDDDNVVEKEAIAALVSVFEKNERAGVLGLVNYSFSDKNKILWVCTKRNMYTSKTDQPRSLDEFSGLDIWDTADVPNAFMVRLSIIADNSIHFRQIFEIMYEESDFAYRIRNAGYGVQVVRSAHIYHDIESQHGEVKIDYMYHVMENSRRPYVFARNRVLFHSLYSTKIQFIDIISIWIWVFALYYSYKIIWYSGVGNFPLSRRIQLVCQYMKGTFDGLCLVRNKSLYEKS